jgi:hypothetical protein
MVSAGQDTTPLTLDPPAADAAKAANDADDADAPAFAAPVPGHESTRRAGPPILAAPSAYSRFIPR